MGIGKWEGFKPHEILLSLLTLAAIFFLADVEKVLGIIAEANPLFFLAAICAYFSTVILMTFRIRYVLFAMHEKISIKGAFGANMGGLLASDFTPARTGYFITPYLLLKNAGVALDKGMGAIVSPQIPEFFLKALGAGTAIALIVYTSSLVSGDGLFLWGGVGVMVIFCTAMWLGLFVPEFVQIVRKFEFLPFVREGADFLELLQKNRQKIHSIFPQIILFSVAIFLLKGFEWYLFGKALGIEFQTPYPEIFVFMVLQPLVTVFQFAPVPTVAGLGLAEGSAVAAMAILGIPAEMAIAYSLLIRGGTVLVNSPGIFQIVPSILKKEKKKQQMP